jgi:hypothetical protein
MKCQHWKRLGDHGSIFIVQMQGKEAGRKERLEGLILLHDLQVMSQDRMGCAEQ